MAYPGIALLTMVGIGLGFALWYFLANDSHHNQGHHGSSAPPPRSLPLSNTSCDSPNEPRRRRRKTIAPAKDECPICHELMIESQMTTQCGHSFHRWCLEEWRKTLATQSCSCPICRRRI